MRMLYDAKTPEPGVVEVSGRVIIGAGSAVTSYSGEGVKEVTRIGAGLWDVEFEDSYPTDLGIDVSDYQATAQATTFVVVTPYNSVTKKTRIGNYDNAGGGAADPTAANGFDITAKFKRVHY